MASPKGNPFGANNLLGSLGGGGMINQLAAQQNQFQSDYHRHRQMAEQQIRTQFEVTAEMQQMMRHDSADAMRYMIETRIKEHEREVMGRLQEMYLTGAGGTSGHIQIRDSGDSLTWKPKGIRAQLQAEIDAWLAPVTV